MQELQKEKLAELIVELVQDKLYTPMKAKEIAMLMGVPREERKDFRQVLDRLCSEGRIGLSKGGRYSRSESFTQAGIFHGNLRGFGFVSLEGRERDVFIPADYVHQAMDGDRVRVIITREDRDGRSAEGQITQILEHAHQTVVGIYRRNKQGGYVVPDNQKLNSDVLISRGDELGAVSGHKVVVRLTGYGDDKRKPRGVITEILGHITDPGVDILSIIRAYGLPESFSPDIQSIASRLRQEIEPEEAERRMAHDFRGLTTVTIDGEDAKDLDDAISLSYNSESKAYKLYVHIADVSHYVREHSLLDQEALNRASSVYLADRVIPMLPRALSNGICSLNEGEDRLSLSCIMEIDASGRLLSHELCESLIRVDKRMSYTGVQAFFDNREPENAESLDSYLDYRELLLNMRELSRLLRSRRSGRGSIDFDFTESKLILDDKGQVEDIVPYVRNEAHLLIEDFMLAANETVAEDCFWQQLPFVYRVHERPELEKMQELSHIVGAFGHVLRIRDEEQIKPKELQKLLMELSGKPEEPVLKTLILRSMKKARYSTECTGHFGLAARYYTHFTSPIRRYPDLQIHRIIKESLSGGLGQKRTDHYEKLLPGVCDRSSTLEKRAEEVERECDKLKKCQYMSRYIGAEFTGVVSGVTAHGLYVQLPNTVEGMIRLQNLRDDYYIFNESGLELTGERGGKRYKLGDRLRVIVESVDKLTRTIDFLLVQEDE